MKCSVRSRTHVYLFYYEVHKLAETVVLYTTKVQMDKIKWDAYNTVVRHVSYIESDVV